MKVRIYILFAGNTMTLDMEESEASAIIQSYKNRDVQQIFTYYGAANYVFNFKDVLGIYYGPIKLSYAEKVQRDYLRGESWRDNDENESGET